MYSYRLFLCFLCSLALSAYAQVEFPMGAEVVNVKEDPYNAKGDGKTDDTEAIQKALSDHPDGDFIIYLPHGIYKISSALTWPTSDKPEKDYRRTILQGESMGGTIIALQDDVPGFENPDFPQAVIYTGDGPNARQRNSIRDLTLRTGKNNPGAIGIRFNASVQGTINNVKVASGDSAGVYGIDLGFTDNIGPLLLKNVEVNGFDVGVYTAGTSNSMTFEHVTLGGQNKFGLDNDNQMLSIRGLRFKGGVTAVYNHGPDATMVFLDCTLEYDPGKKAAKGITAIVNEGQIFARAVVVSKFKSKIKSTKKAYNESFSNTEIIEFSTQENHQLCHSPKTSLKLSVTETPSKAEQKSMYWTSITGEYGGKANGSDDSKAIQDAIDDGAETIFFPPGGRWTINRDIYLRNRIHRLIGTEGKIDGKGKFIIEDGAFVDITIERFSSFASGITNRSKRSVVLKNMFLKSYESDDFATGDIFLEDVSVGTIRTNFQRLWGRQVTMAGDTKGPKISNNGGTIWILGLTAKDGNTVLHNFNKGFAELMGVNVIASDKAKTGPMFINDNSSMSIAGLKETLTRGNPYAKIVEDSRQGSKVYTLKNTDLPHNESGGVMMALYTGYAPKQGQNEPPKPTMDKEHILVQPGKLRLKGEVEDDGRGDGLCRVPVVWRKAVGPGKVSFSDSTEYETDVTFTASGRYNLLFFANDGYQEKSDTGKVYVFDKRYTTLDNSGDNIPSGRGADTWISQFDNYSPHSTDENLRVAHDKNDAGKIYLKFDLSALPGPLFDAALKLEFDTDSIKKPVQLNIFGLKETSKDMKFGEDKLGIDWKSDELTWENAPANLDQPGGQFNIRKSSGGGVDTKYADFLGIITINPKAPLGAFLRTPAFTEFFKRKHASGLYTLILTAVEPGETFIKSRNSGKNVAPALYVGYYDNSRSVGGEAMDGGYTLSKVNIDIVNLECSFDLTVGYPQFVQIEIVNESGKRMLTVAARELAGEKKTNFKFKAKAFPTGKYTLKIIGEAFTAEQKFFILN
jgi:hypothetical protein